MPEGDDVIEQEIRISAPPEAVFPFFTDPDKMRRWKGMDHKLDAQPGGELLEGRRQGVGSRKPGPPHAVDGLRADIQAHQFGRNRGDGVGGGVGFRSACDDMVGRQQDSYVLFSGFGE